MFSSSFTMPNLLFQKVPLVQGQSGGGEFLLVYKFVYDHHMESIVEVNLSVGTSLDISNSSSIASKEVSNDFKNKVHC